MLKSLGMPKKPNPTPKSGETIAMGPLPAPVRSRCGELVNTGLPYSQQGTKREASLNEPVWQSQVQSLRLRAHPESPEGDGASPERAPAHRICSSTFSANAPDKSHAPSVTCTLPQSSRQSQAAGISFGQPSSRSSIPVVSGASDLGPRRHDVQHPMVREMPMDDRSHVEQVEHAKRRLKLHICDCCPLKRKRFDTLEGLK